MLHPKASKHTFQISFLNSSSPYYSLFHLVSCSHWTVIQRLPHISPRLARQHGGTQFGDLAQIMQHSSLNLQLLPCEHRNLDESRKITLRNEEKPIYTSSMHNLYYLYLFKFIYHDWLTLTFNTFQWAQQCERQLGLDLEVTASLRQEEICQPQPRSCLNGLPPVVSGNVVSLNYSF